MNVISLMVQINECYKDNNYEETLKLLDKYFSIKSVGIGDRFLEIYINCQIKLGLFDGARRNIRLMRELFPKYYSEYDLGLRYSYCRDTIELDKIILEYNFLELELYHVAKSCFYNGLYEQAIELFNRFLLVSKDNDKIEEANEYLYKIRIYQSYNNIFNSVNYGYFKSKGDKLVPGHVIYVDRIRDCEENKYINDLKKDNRAYMIWKIDGEKIYAFAITTQVRKRYEYVLVSTNYPAIGVNRVVKDNLVCIYERDITKVVDKVRDEDYKEVILTLYRNLCYRDQSYRKIRGVFISEMVKKIDVQMNDVILVHGDSLRDNRFYFVIDVDLKKEKYKVLEVRKNDNYEFEIMNMDVNMIDIDAPIINVIKLNQERINKLLDQVPTNYKRVNMLGKVVRYDDKELEIMMEEDKYYLCIDRTISYSSSNIGIYFLRKDVPLFAILSFSNDIYRKHLLSLEEYINNNFWQVSQKKQEFLVRNRVKKII